MRFSLANAVLASLGLGLVLGIASVVAADDRPASPSAARFEALKKLAGDWVEIGPDSKPTDKVVSSFRVTAAGSVLKETLFPGTPKEMVTMYHLDGPDLVLTHYCALANQPRMRAEAAQETNRFVFRFIGGTNLRSEADSHMHQVTFTMPSDDRLQAEWVASQDGKACHCVKLDLARKSASR